MRELTTLARDLRKKSTQAEKLLWRHLRMKQLDGCKFRRQEPIDRYIVDFVCFEKRVVIEADGGQHDGNERDIERDDYLKNQGFIVLRFWNNEILSNIRSVLEVIQDKCRDLHPPQAPPVKGGEVR